MEDIKTITFETGHYKTGYARQLHGNNYLPYYQAESIEEAEAAYEWCPYNTLFMVNEVDRAKQTGKSYQVHPNEIEEE